MTLTSVIIGSQVNAYGLLRSLGENGIRCAIACRDSGPAVFSRYVSRRWKLPDDSPTQRSVNKLLEMSESLIKKPILFPTDEAWVVAILDNRRRFEKNFLLPMGTTKTIRLTLTKTRMYQWCLDNDIRAPHTEVFHPGGDWQSYLCLAEDFFPVILKPETKGVGDKALGFVYKEFGSMKDLSGWAQSQGKGGPECGIIFQEVIPGPPRNLYSYQGYRSADGNVFMTAYRKIRQTPPVHGCATAADILYSDEGTKLAVDLLEKLGFCGFFDLEFKKSDRDDLFYFIELNPRPGMLNYGSTAIGCNLPLAACMDKAAQSYLPEKQGSENKAIWVRLLGDMFLHAFYYRIKGQGTGLREWFRSLHHSKRIYAYFNRDDILVGIMAFMRMVWLVILHFSKYIMVIFCKIFSHRVIRQ